LLVLGTALLVLALRRERYTHALSMMSVGCMLLAAASRTDIPRAELPIFAAAGLAFAIHGACALRPALLRAAIRRVRSARPMMTKARVRRENAPAAGLRA
jgi:hypothetical protein